MARHKTINFTAIDATGERLGNVRNRHQCRVRPSTVADRLLFYKGSARYDQTGGTNGRPAAIPFSDDNAIATDKSAYLPNNTSNAMATAATIANLSSYDQGINGIMVDLTSPSGGNHSAIQSNFNASALEHHQ